jgi:hypothetical protein
MGANLVIISLPPVGNEADRVRDNQREASAAHMATTSLTSCVPMPNTGYRARRSARRRPRLPLAPRRGRETRLARGRGVGPDHCRLAILPLDGDVLVSNLEAALIHSEVAEDGLGLHLQQSAWRSAPSTVFIGISVRIPTFPRTSC